MPWVSKATDSFNRANEIPLAGNWGAWASPDAQRLYLRTNVVNSNSLGSDSLAGYTAVVFSDDHYSKATITNLTGGTANGTDGAGVVCRFSEGNHSSTYAYYRLTSNGTSTGNICLRKRTSAGVSSTLANYTSVWVSGDIIELRVQGAGASTVLTVLKNSVELGTVPDASGLSGGVPGLGYSSTITDFNLDDWEGGEFSGNLSANDAPRGFLGRGAGW